MSDTEMTNELDNDAPTQALIYNDRDQDTEFDPSDAPTQALTQHMDGVDDDREDDIPDGSKMGTMRTPSPPTQT